MVARVSTCPLFHNILTLTINIPKGATSLILAAENGHTEVVAALLASGADVNAEGQVSLSNSVWSCMCSRNSSRKRFHFLPFLFLWIYWTHILKNKQTHTYTPTHTHSGHMACFFFHVSLLIKILKNTRTHTHMHKQVEFSSFHPSFNFTIIPRPQDGWRALHFAAAYGKADVVALLVEHDADVDAENNVSVANF